MTLANFNQDYQISIVNTRFYLKNLSYRTFLSNHHKTCQFSYYCQLEDNILARFLSAWALKFNTDLKLVSNLDTYS